MPASPAVRRRTVGATVLAGLVVTAGKLVADTLAGTSAVGPVDALAYAAKSKLRGARPFPAEVVVVAVDEASIRALGRFPWPRSVFARLTDKLAGAGAQAVGFDIVFAEPEGRPELARLESEVRAARGALGTGASPAALDRLDRAAQALAVAAGGDAAFADALRRFGRAVLGFALVPPEDATARGVIDADAAALDAHAGVAPLSAVRVVSGFRTEAPVRQRAAHALLPLPPLPELVAAAGAAGAINTVADGDGEVRGVMLVAFDRGGHAFPSLALAAVARSGELALRRFRPLAWATDDSGVERLATPWGDGAGASVPLSATGRMLLSFYGPLLRPDGSPVVPTWSEIGRAHV